MPRLVLEIYSDDLALTEAAVPSVYVICIATIVSAIAMVFFEAVSGTGNTAAAMILEFGVLVLYLGFIYFMTKNASIEGVWTAELLYNVMMGLVSYLYLKKANWLKKKI